MVDVTNTTVADLKLELYTSTNATLPGSGAMATFTNLGTGTITYQFTVTAGHTNFFYKFVKTSTEITNYKLDNLTLNRVNAKYKAVALMKADYYPFGMQMEGTDRKYVASGFGGYRYAYNGMEVDPETKGNGNSYTTEFRQYDPRLGRWASLDPLMAKYPSMSPYCAFNNNPVFFTDPFGLEGTNPDGDLPVGPPEMKSAKDGKATAWEKNDVLVAPSGIWYQYDGKEWGQLWTIGEIDVTAKKTGWTRFWGVVKAVGGVCEAVIGTALIVTGVGAPLGAVFFVHGADVAASGVTQAITGEETQTLTYQAINSTATSLGASEETADFIAGTTEMAISAASGGATTKLPSTISTTVATSESITMATEEVIETFASNGKLTDEFVEGVQLQGSYDISRGLADFTIDHVKNTTGIKNYAFSNLTSKFEGMAQVSGVNQVRIIFKEVVNSQLRNNSTWAAKYGYEYVPNDGYGTVIWSKALK